VLFSLTTVFKVDAVHFAVPSLCPTERRRQIGQNNKSLYVTLCSAAHTGLDTKKARFLRVRHHTRGQPWWKRLNVGIVLSGKMKARRIEYFRAFHVFCVTLLEIKISFTQDLNTNTQISDSTALSTCRISS